MKKILVFLLGLCFMGSLATAQTEFTFTHFNTANTPAFSGNNFKCAAVSRTGQIWVGSQYQGLVKYDPSLNAWSKSPDLTNVFVADIKADRLEGVWIAQAGTSGQSGGGSNIAGGVNNYPGTTFSNMSFYSITSGGGLTSRNARSIWLDKYHNGPDGKQRVWVAQGTYITSGTTTAGGISVGLNLSQNYFTKIYQGLQVTPWVTAPNAGTPNCLSVAGNRDEVWVFAATNFGRSQILRFRSEGTPGTFLGVYDYTNTPQLSAGFRANAMYFDDLGRAWVGLNSGGIVIKVNDEWKTMNDPAVFPPGVIVNANAITSDQLGNIYIGTSSGLVIYRTGAVDSAGSYRRVTTIDGLPSNNINGVATDTVGNRMILATDAGVSFMAYNKKVDATLEWDFSFPTPEIKPKGVVADGASRLFIKVRRSAGITAPIKKITATIKNVGTQVSSMLGKLKIANTLTQYSNEANTGTAVEVSRTDSTPTGDYYFWYVAPDDFSSDPVSKEANMSEREDSVKVKVTYMDDTEDSSYVPVKVQRPPVLFSSMLGNISSIASKIILSNGKSLLKHDNIGKILMVQMNQLGDIAQNISRLIDGDILQNEDKKNSIQGLLEGVRNMGYAATKADVVAHGIAGVVVRATMAVKSQKFLADGNFIHNNYGKGFINKLVSINVPHNGSPLFDMIKEMGPKLNGIANKALGSLVKADPGGSLLPYAFLKLRDSLLGPLAELLEKATIDSAAIKLPLTTVKNHLLVTDADATPEKVEAAKTYRGGLFGPLLTQVNIIFRDNVPGLFKDSMTNLFSSINGEAAKILKGLDLFSQLKGVPNFSGDGDLVVPVSSQAAGQTSGLFSHISKISGTIINKLLHDSVLTNPLVPDKIMELLNSSILNSVFANSIPANNTVSPIQNLVNKATKLLYDTTKIVTDEREVLNNGNFRPVAGAAPAQTLSILTDTTIRLKFRVKDTAKLQYVFIQFQDTMYTSTSKLRNQEVMLRVKKNFLYAGLQELTAVGVYETADSVIYHADTVSTYILAPDSVQDFRVTVDEFNLYDGIPLYPSYEVKIKDEWQPLPASDSNILITIENAAKLAYDTSRLAFDAAGDGFSRAYFRYKTFRDTVSFDCLLPQSLTAVNRTVINGNFRSASTWSKGRPPLPGDSIIISAGHTIVLDSTVQVRSLRIDSLGTLTLNNASRQMQLGDAEDGDFMLDNYGTLNISNGTLTVKGRVKHNRFATFTMTGGNLIIDGNTGSTITSLQNGLFLFEAAPQMQSFAFTGGTLQIVDPPIGVASQAISCPYNFGVNSTLVLGNGISLTASDNPNGFGGAGFPPQIGRLVLDAGSNDGNRQLTITQPLNVKGTFEIRTGSNLVIKAPTNVTQ
jgi:hypothetical protein